MTCRIVFRPAARHDFSEAFAWYEEQRAGLGGRFEAAVEAILERIAESPEAFPGVHRDVRRALLRRFPYGVFYRLRGDTVHILAIMHGRRNPSLWQSRADAD